MHASKKTADQIVTGTCENFGYFMRSILVNLRRMVRSFALPVADEAKLSNRKKHRDLQITVLQDDNVFDRETMSPKGL